jgi:hypothetical protein
MNAQETLVLLEALRASGASHFKSQDFEVSFGKTIDPAATGSTPAPLLGKGPSASAPSAGSETPENKEATAKLKGLIETMKLDDASLIDKIFPAGAGG